MSGPSTAEVHNVAGRLRTIVDPTSLLIGLFAHAPTALQVYTADGRCLVVNQAFRELFGQEPPPDYNVLEDDIARRHGMLPLIRRAFAGETIHLPPVWYDPRELKKFDTPHGRRVAIETTLFPLVDADGRIGHVALCFKDVSAQLELQAERDRLKAAGQALARSEREATAALLLNRQIQAADHLKSEFLANLSHELRTPLCAIIGFAELLFDGQVDPRSAQHKEFLGDILASGKHLLRLINGILDFATLDSPVGGKESV